MISIESLPLTLYHYCSTETFYSIVTNKQLWMSSLVMSNDSLEGKWALEVASYVAKRRLTSMAADTLLATMREMALSYTCVGLCLSEKRDLLSQWRGYATNGAGICVGVSTEAIGQVIGSRRASGDLISMYDVLYDEEDQEEIFENEYKLLKPIMMDGDFDFDEIPKGGATNRDLFEKYLDRKRAGMSAVKEALWEFFPNLYRLKSPAFAEEAEWRVTREIIGDSYEGYRFRPAATKIVPYDILDFKNIKREFINEVIIGPKHDTPVEIVEGFLHEYGFYKSNVTKSNASYK